MTEKPYTDADVELVASTFIAEAKKNPIDTATPPWMGVQARMLLGPTEHDIARAVLNALVAAGRLIPASTTPARTAIEEALTASERQRWGDVPDRVAIAQWADEIHRGLIAAGHIAEEPV